MFLSLESIDDGDDYWTHADYACVVPGYHRQSSRRQIVVYVIVRPLSTVGYTSVVASVIHSIQWSN